jgi:hypothetical protein
MNSTTYRDTLAFEGASRERASKLYPTWLDVVALCAVFGTGLSHVYSPFAGDQFLYLVGAHKVAHGVMYREFWDLKQPLIFYFYAAAGQLFGFTEAGIHLFEAFYQTIFAAALIAVCAPRFRFRWVASIVPLLTIVPYYAFANNDALTSVEALAGFPIFLAAFWATDSLRTERGSIWRATAAGIAGGLAAALKLAFLPLVVALWAVPLTLGIRRDGSRRFRLALFLILGCAAPLAILAVHFKAAGVLNVALLTTFVDPLVIFQQLAPAYRSPFWLETGEFARAMWPLVTLAFIGMLSDRRRPDVLSRQMAVWIVAGFALIVLQVWSFYYKFFIVVVPMGVLSASGIDGLWSVARARGGWTKVLLVGTFGVMVASSTLVGLRMRSRWFLWASENQRATASERSFLNRADARPGPIYIFGDPRMYYYSGRDQAVSINGWSPQLLLPAEWHRLRDELDLAAPPYIMVQSTFMPIVRKEPAMVAFISSRYRVAFTSRDGTWYERRRAGLGLRESAPNR